MRFVAISLDFVDRSLNARCFSFNEIQRALDFVEFSLKT